MGTKPYEKSHDKENREDNDLRLLLDMFDQQELDNESSDQDMSDSETLGFSDKWIEMLEDLEHIESHKIYNQDLVAALDEIIPDNCSPEFIPDFDGINLLPYLTLTSHEVKDFYPMPALRELIVMALSGVFIYKIKKSPLANDLAALIRTLQAKMKKLDEDCKSGKITQEQIVELTKQAIAREKTRHNQIDPELLEFHDTFIEDMKEYLLNITENF